MPSKRTLIRLITVMLVVSAFLVTARSANGAGKEHLLYSFCPVNPCPDGVGPEGRVVFDSSGNLYGTAFGGGAFGYGTVFKLTPSPNGKWTEKVLHSFNLTDGAFPYGDLIFDDAGNLYGTTYEGGAFYDCGEDQVYGCGTVFELTHTADGKWNHKVLHNFSASGKDGYYPASGLIIDAAGNLYGATYSGGLHTSCPGYLGCGTVFRLTPGANGTWKEEVLHSFKGINGYDPNGDLIFDAAGNLYGTTYQGGGYNSSCYHSSCGTVFELSPTKNNDWTEAVLYRFKGKDGEQPIGGLIFDPDGNLYGTTYSGGAYSGCGSAGCGVAFQLTPRTSGEWREEILHNFGAAKDGTSPAAGMISDAAGNLYGTTQGGGAYGNNCGPDQACGTVFQLTTAANGKWVEKLLHSFSGFPDGDTPAGRLILDGTGNLYGTAADGGVYQAGAVFEITP